jgi:hypothetical protein
MRYQKLSRLTWAELQEALRRDDAEELALAVVSAALYLEDPVLATAYCLQLADHESPLVRGNTLLAFAHVARIHGWLDRARVAPLMQRGLIDDHEWVRTQARNAIDDLAHFLGWTDLAAAT